MPYSNERLFRINPGRTSQIQESDDPNTMRTLYNHYEKLIPILLQDTPRESYDEKFTEMNTCANILIDIFVQGGIFDTDGNLALDSNGSPIKCADIDPEIIEKATNSSYLSAYQVNYERLVESGLAALFSESTQLGESVFVIPPLFSSRLGFEIYENGVVSFMLTPKTRMPKTPLEGQESDKQLERRDSALLGFIKKPLYSIISREIGDVRSTEKEDELSNLELQAFLQAVMLKIALSHGQGCVIDWRTDKSKLRLRPPVRSKKKRSSYGTKF